MQVVSNDGPSSCLEVKLLHEHPNPGYYILHSEDTYDLVKCNMHLPTSDAKFQGRVLKKWSKTSVAFDLGTTVSQEKQASRMFFSNVNLDTSNATNLAGTFTAPLDGVYQVLQVLLKVPIQADS